MLLKMQDFDFFPNLIKFYTIYQNFAQICLKKFDRECGRILSSYAHWFNAIVM